MNINNPLVSIFILCFNHEKYVSEAIESAINQTYQNIEIVIVDNASTDNSRIIIEYYVKKDKRIKFLPIEYNTLPSYGSNLAINQCCGEYIAALSADDFFEFDKIQIQLEYMISCNLDISFTWINAVNSKSELISQSFTEKWFNRSDVQTRKDILKQYIEYKNVTNAVSAMFKKDFFLNNKFDHRLLQTQDYDLWVQLLSKTDKVNVLQKKLTNYRILDDGSNLSLDKSNIRINRTHFEMIYVFQKFINYPNDLLSSMLQIEVNDDNKFESLYNKFEQEKNLYGQLSLLLYIFQDLGENCDVHSKKFKFFFENYGKFDIRYLEIGDILEKKINELTSLLYEKEKNIENIQEGKDWFETQVKSLTLLLEEKEGVIYDLEKKNDELENLKKTFIYKLIRKVGLI